jgi:BirA family biotin operon repressor/biotin-[acetyl-CoA-carboxylase] ligase
VSQAPGWRWRICEELPSTNDACIAAATAGEPERLAVLAHRQTQGRGRGGHVWQAPAGNLNLSVLLRPEGDAVEAGRWGLIAAVALAETVEAWLPDPAVLRLKWPNDLLLSGAKLSGILAESALQPDGRLDWLVIGFGVNLAAAPALPDRAAACLADAAGTAPAAEAFAAALLERLDAWRRVRLLEGFAPVRAAWLRRAAPAGTAMSLQTGGEAVGGIFAGLSDEGHLLLESGGRVRAFASGEASCCSS